MKAIEEYVRSIPDFPEPGIIFRDVTSILQDAEGLHLAIDLMQEKLKDVEFDVVVGPESRGFIFGVPIAYNLHKPFIPIRKKESSLARLFLLNMNWNMVLLRSRCIKMRLNRDKEWLSLTT